MFNRKKNRVAARVQLCTVDDPALILVVTDVLLDGAEQYKIFLHVDIKDGKPTTARVYWTDDDASCRLDSTPCDCGQYEVMFKELQEKLRKEAGAT